MYPAMLTHHDTAGSAPGVCQKFERSAAGYLAASDILIFKSLTNRYVLDRGHRHRSRDQRHQPLPAIAYYHARGIVQRHKIHRLDCVSTASLYFFWSPGASSHNIAFALFAFSHVITVRAKRTTNRMHFQAPRTSIHDDENFSTFRVSITSPSPPLASSSISSCSASSSTSSLPCSLRSLEGGSSSGSSPTLPRMLGSWSHLGDVYIKKLFLDICFKFMFFNQAIVHLHLHGIG